MLSLLVAGLLFPEQFTSLLERPELYLHAKFVHVLCVTLFVANAVIGTIWETRSLLSKNIGVIRHTYQTVVWLDAVFTAPLIIISVMSGITLGTILGGVWSLGWLSVAFALFLFSGAVWVIADIPTQYKVNQHFRALSEDAQEIPAPLLKLLWRRTGISLLGTAPLIIIFYLMIHKPALPTLNELF